jgi:DNA primase catalytic subunit
MESGAGKSEKEQRIRSLTQVYYSRKDVQKALFDFSKNRETIPRYFEGFGKRPDSFQYPGDIFELVKKGATSFHCSEELWLDTLKISTEMPKKKVDELRQGWDLLFDIDSKYLDYSKILAELIIKFLRFYGVKNMKIKFSGSKGFHLIVPWKAFPKEIYGTRTKDMFPEWPRIITMFIMSATKEELITKITELTKPNKYVRDFKAPKEVMPDLILVSPRHLFRMPYSLHEKTALASVVLETEEIKDFQPRDADPLKVKVRDFMPEAEEGEASELLREALDWYKNKHPDETSNKDSDRAEREFKPIQLSNISEELFPPTIKKILLGVRDGRKRAVFILLNFFRSIGMDRKDIEKYLYGWNEKNEVPIKEGYIKSQLSWAYRNKPVPPPNYDKDYYKALGIEPTEEELRYKNPSNYMIKKTFQRNTKKAEYKKPRKSRKRD